MDQGEPSSKSFFSKVQRVYNRKSVRFASRMLAVTILAIMILLDWRIRSADDSQTKVFFMHWFTRLQLIGWAWIFFDLVVGERRQSGHDRSRKDENEASN